MPQMLYDSESFVVVHDVGNNDEIERAILAGLDRARIDLMVQHIYEIVDKRSERCVCLSGGMAELFLEVTKGWMMNAPDQAKVEDTLEGYCELAQIPVIVH